MTKLGKFVAAWVAVACGLGANGAETWRVSEIAFESRGATGADVELDVVFTQDGRTLRRPAFWDGGNVYRVRFALPTVGKWSWRTEAAGEKSLDGRKGEVDVKPYAGKLDIYCRGFVRPAAGAKHFEYADGTPFLYLGDTHWGFGREAEDDATNAAAHHVETVVKRRVEQGFTVWQSEPLGCSFDLTDGTIDEKDIPGFRIFDRAWRTVADAGLVHANAQFFFPSKMTPPLCSDEKALRRLTRYWVARYGAYPVMWTLGQEVDNDFYRGKPWGQKHWSAADNPYVKVAEFIRQFDAYRHPLTAHQENVWETAVTGYGEKRRESAFADTNVAARCGHDWWGAQWSPALNGPQSTEMLSDYWNDRRVAVNYEGRYCGLWALDFGARAQAWISYLSGFRGYGYGAADLWLFKSTYDMNKPSSNGVEVISIEMKHTPWRKALEFDSAKQMRFFRDYMDGLAWWKLVPDLGTGRCFSPDAATKGAAVAAADGTRLALAYVFDRTGTATGSFTNLLANTRYRLERFNPRTGERASLGDQLSDASGTLVLPARPDREDWVFSATECRDN